MKAMKMIFVLAVFYSIVTTGCKKDSEQEVYRPGPRQFHVNLTDGPADFARIEITPDKVEAYHDSHGWITLSSDLRIINVLSLTNEYKTSLAAASYVQPGHYSRLRIHFADANTVIVHTSVTIGGTNIEPGFTTPLTWGGAPDQWVEIAINHEVSGSMGVEVLLDFDAAASVYAGSDSYVINPVMREVQ